MIKRHAVQIMPLKDVEKYASKSSKYSGLLIAQRYLVLFSKNGMKLLLPVFVKKKILIIEDEFELCMLLKLHLVAKNYEVEMAYNIKYGMAKLHNYILDIIFLDNNLLMDMDGKKCIILKPHILQQR